MSTIKSSAENLTLNADGANNDIKFQSNGVEKASIDQDGNVAASGTITSNGQAQLNNNNLISTNTGATGEWIAKRTSSGEGIHITTTNASGADTQRLAITCNADSADFIVKDSDIVFGTAGKGICLGVTSNTDSNTLDDYEEGTWTPTYVPVSGSFSAIGYTSGGGVGRYTKIGNLVCLMCQMGNTNMTVSTASGDLRVGGIPFTPSAVGAGNWGQGITAEKWGGDNPMGVQIRENEVTFDIKYKTAANGTMSNLNVTDMDTGGDSNYLRFTLSYITG